MSKRKFHVFDTLTYAKKLKKVGFTEGQAETQAEALADVINNNLATKDDINRLEEEIKGLELTTKEDIKRLELATKEDIKRLELATKGDLKKMEISNKRDLKQLENKLLIRLSSVMITVGSFLSGLIVVFSH